MARIRRKGPNKYLISIYLGRGDNGKRKEKSEMFYGTIQQAKLRASELEVKLKKKKKRFGPAKGMTLGKYLRLWLERVEGTVAGRTWQKYRWQVEKLLQAEGLPDLPLYDLTAFELQGALSSLRGILKPRTLKDLHSVLKTALRQAAAWGIMDADITAGLRPPRVPKQERRVLAPEELKKLLEAASAYKHYLPIRLMALAGLRLGEVLGLKWSDLDFDTGTMSVRRSVNIRTRQLQQTKTAAGERELLLDKETIKLLKEHRKKQAKDLRARASGLIFATPDGRPLREMAVRRAFYAALRKAGLPHMRLHDLRHTAGSLLLDAGCSLPTVAAFLGHSSPATTAAVYAHAVRKGGVVIDFTKMADQKRRTGGRKP